MTSLVQEYGLGTEVVVVVRDGDIHRALSGEELGADGKVEATDHPSSGRCSGRAAGSAGVLGRGRTPHLPAGVARGRTPPRPAAGPGSGRRLVDHARWSATALRPGPRARRRGPRTRDSVGGHAVREDSVRGGEGPYE
ncbi:hypothetical protein NKH77_28410 [Streptomyces sp. M19]